MNLLYLYFVLTLGSALLGATLTLTGWFRRESSAAMTFTIMLSSITIWAVLDILIMVSHTPETAALLNRMRMTLFSAAPGLWLIFTLSYSDQENWMRLPVIFALAIIPLLNLFFIWIPQLQQFFSQSVFIRQGPFMVWQQWQTGFWFWIHIFYALLLILLGVTILIQAGIRIYPEYHGQAISLILGAIVLFAVTIIPTFRVIPNQKVDLMPIGFTISGGFVALAIFRYRLLDLKPLAHSFLLENMEDGMLALDKNHRIIDMNSALQRILETGSDELIGRQVNKVFSEWEEMLERYGAEDIAGSEWVLEKNDRRYYFDFKISPLWGGRPEPVGHLIILRDITARKKVETEREKLISDLRDAFEQIKTLSGLLPICSSCKKIRDDKGYWHQVESYISSHSDAEFSHGLCPECIKELYPGYKGK